MQYLVVRVGEEGDGIGGGRRSLGLRSREGCAWVLGRWRKERSARAFGWIFSRMPGDDGSRTRRGPVRFGRGLTRKRESEGGDADADGDFEQELREWREEAGSDTWRHGSRGLRTRGEERTDVLRVKDGEDTALARAYLLLIVVRGRCADVKRGSARHHQVASSAPGHRHRGGAACGRARDASRWASGSRTRNERELRARSAGHRAAARGKRERGRVNSRDDDRRHGRQVRRSRSDPPQAKERRQVWCGRLDIFLQEALVSLRLVVPPRKSPASHSSAILGLRAVHPPRVEILPEPSRSGSR